MKVIKRIAGVVSLFCLILMSVGCVRMDLGVEIMKDGKGSLASKISIEASAYESLLSMSGSEGVTMDSSVELDKFVKETINDKLYYSYQETMEFESYEDLSKALLDSGEDAAFIEKATISGDNKNFFFEIITAKQTDNAEASINMPANWLTVSMTVKMPGKITETTGEKIDDNTVKFVMNDFSEAKTYSVSSVEKSSAGVVLLIAFGALLVIGIGLIIFKKIKTRY